MEQCIELTQIRVILQVAYTKCCNESYEQSLLGANVLESVYAYCIYGEKSHQNHFSTVAQLYRMLDWVKEQNG